MTIKNVHQRLAEVMASVTYIQKERKQGMQYTIVSHDAVTAKVRPALLASGIVYYPTRCEHTQNGNRAECSMTVRFVNIDAPEDFFEVHAFGYGVDAQDKGPGKAMSYAVKYALLKALGLETGDDADHDSIDHVKSDPAIPQFNAPAAAQRIKDKLNKCKTLQDLKEVWVAELPAIADVKDVEPALEIQIVNLKEKLKGELHSDPARQSPGEAA